MKLAKKKPWIHAKPHYGKDGGCLCHCAHCVSWTPGEARGVGLESFAKCICRRCNENCPGIGRLGEYSFVERERKVNADGR